MMYQVDVQELSPSTVASVRRRVRFDELGQTMPMEFGRIARAIGEAGLYPVGPPVALYRDWKEDTVDLEVGFPVSGQFSERGDVRPSEVPGGRVAHTTYMGRYDGIQEAYAAIQDYARENGLELGDAMWERYLTSPQEEPDLEKHVTEVYWLLK